MADRRFVVTATYSYTLTFNDTLVQLTDLNRFTPDTPELQMPGVVATKWKTTSEKNQDNAQLNEQPIKLLLNWLCIS